jgi:hypothetical protein
MAYRQGRRSASSPRFVRWAGRINNGVILLSGISLHRRLLNGSREPGAALFSFSSTLAGRHGACLEDTGSPSGG